MVIASGGVKVERDGAPIAELGAGEFFGEVALVTGAPRNATVTSTEPSTLLVLTDRAFWRLAEEIPELSSSVLKAMAARLEPETV